jgi:hypothetical protein
MSTALTTIFGTEISVAPTPRRAQRQYYGFPGSHGVSAMQLGSRGWSFIVHGRLRATGTTYAGARVTLEAAISVIEAWQWADAEDFTFGSSTYANCVMDKLELVPGPDGKPFHFTGGAVFCDFVAYFTGIL